MITGTIYIIQAKGTNLYKIGWTGREDPAVRLRELQTGNPYSLNIIHTFRGTVADEQDLHQAFSVFQVHGEWFNIPIGPLIESIALTRQALLQPHHLAEDQHPQPADNKGLSSIAGGDACAGGYGQVCVVSGTLAGLEGFYSEEISWGDACIHEDYRHIATSPLAGRVYLPELGEEVFLPLEALAYV